MTFRFHRSLRAAVTLAVTAAALLAFAPGAFATSTAGFNADDELVVLGTDDAAPADDITITRTGTDPLTMGAIYRVADTTGVTANLGEGCLLVDANTVDCTDPTPLTPGVIRLAGHLGDDVLRVGSGQSAADWGSAMARVIGRGGSDQIYGSPVRDEMEGGVGNDVLDGAGGDDDVSGGGQFVDGGATNMGVDRVYGGPGGDTVSDGEAGGDVHDNDTLDGGICPDAACSGGAEAAGDTDRLYMLDVPLRGTPRTAPITVNLGAGTAGQAGETNSVLRFEAVITGNGDDTVTGGPGANEFYTQGGNDFVNSAESPAAGDDVIDCGAGNKDALQADAADPAGISCEVTGTPAPPGGVSASASGQNAINVSWADSPQGTSYEVLRTQPTASGSPVATTAGLSAPITGLMAGTRYCFTVRAVNRFGTSGPSTEACATTSSVASTPPAGGGGNTGGGNTGGGNTGAGNAGPSQAQAAQAAGTAATRAARSLVKARLKGLFGRGVTLRSAAPGGGTVTYTLTGPARGKRITLAQARKLLSGSGSYSLKLKGSKAAGKRLKGVRKVKVTLTVRYTTNSGLISTATRKVTLKR